jgi:hypothetical protein
MSNMRAVSGLGLSLSVSILAACGNSTPAQPAPVPTPTPTPAPTPPPKALSVIPPCPLPASMPGETASCTTPQRRLEQAVNAAIDRALRDRPDLLNFSNVNGGPQVLNIDEYMIAVVAALVEAGLCGKVDAEGEIGVKTDNSFNEQWIIVSRAGWSVPTDHWVQRKYVGACAPSTF